MRIKPALRFIETFQIIGVIILLVSAYYYFFSFGDFTYLIFAIAGMAILAGTILFKRKIIQFVLARVDYPGVFFDLCERLRFIDNLSVDESDKVLDDLYYPQYDTDQFLADNGLTAEIRNAGSTQSSALAISTAIFMVALLLIRPHINRWLLPVLFFALVALVRYFIPKRGKGLPLYTFTPEGIITEQGIIAWQSVYDWTAGAKAGKGRSIMVQFVEPGRKALILYPYHLTHSNVEILMLLAHYKHKYGGRVN
ncbi:hypothetical protein [Taibaiella soli]|uniref:Uncharacterized protein n=1 Tax=Taibaiella soli TaxID=1649169 RepID=A0A2W2B4Y5_9BACT|nr:hypothetical protein [Taibaiella soli]PZF71147.1 hypothetical protein DN068_19415 [Taibaiella soli]